MGSVYIPSRGRGWNEGRGGGLRSSAWPWAKPQLGRGQPSLPFHSAHSFVLYAGPRKGGGPDASGPPRSLGPSLMVPGRRRGRRETAAEEEENPKTRARRTRRLLGRVWVGGPTPGQAQPIQLRRVWQTGVASGPGSADASGGPQPGPRDWARLWAVQRWPADAKLCKETPTNSVMHLSVCIFGVKSITCLYYVIYNHAMNNAYGRQWKYGRHVGGVHL
jgi:hypothetical protein